MSRSPLTFIVACGVMGLCILIAGIVCISVAHPDEITTWYGVTMCPCVDCPAISCPAADNQFLGNDCSIASTTYQGVFLTQSQQCRANPPMTQLEGTAQTFTMEKSLFSMDGLEYHPVIYRSEGGASVTFHVEDNEGKVIMGGKAATLQGTGDLTVVPQESEEYEDQSEDKHAEPESQGSRKLMKGGRSSAASSPGRVRSGSSGRWGSGTYARKTSYGYSSCCVSRGTLIYVHRDGPRTSRGYYDTDEDGFTDCSSSKGCAYEASADMNRDELDEFSLVPKKDMKWPLKLVVDQIQSTSYAKDGRPAEVYISWWTEDPDNSKTASYVLLPLGSCMMVFPGLVVLFF